MSTIENRITQHKSDHNAGPFRCFFRRYLPLWVYPGRLPASTAPGIPATLELRLALGLPQGARFLLSFCFRKVDLWLGFKRIRAG
jgi:hypothetical protein